MAEQQPLSTESLAIRAHLTILQGIVQRMADNSRACKTWCITLVSAILILVARQGVGDLLLLAGIPLLLFLLLDTYYLALERRFRRSYEAFVAKVHAGTVGVGDLYAIRPSGSQVGEWANCLLSFAIWPFYILLIVLILLARCFL